MVLLATATIVPVVRPVVPAPYICCGRGLKDTQTNKINVLITLSLVSVLLSVFLPALVAGFVSVL